MSAPYVFAPYVAPPAALPVPACPWCGVPVLALRAAHEPSGIVWRCVDCGRVLLERRP